MPDPLDLDPADPEAAPEAGVPAPMRVAAVLVLLEGALLVVFAITEVVSLDSFRKK